MACSEVSRGAYHAQKHCGLDNKAVWKLHIFVSFICVSHKVFLFSFSIQSACLKWAYNTAEKKNSSKNVIIATAHFVQRAFFPLQFWTFLKSHFLYHRRSPLLSVRKQFREKRDTGHFHLQCQRSTPSKMKEKKNQKCHSSSTALFKEFKNLIT